MSAKIRPNPATHQGTSTGSTGKNAVASPGNLRLVQTGEPARYETEPLRLASPASVPSWQVLHGDCLERMRELPDCSIDSVITDPPYGLSEQPDIYEVMRCWSAGKPYRHRSRGFLEQDWDSFVPGPEHWTEAMRVLKPGGYVLAFSAPRCADMLGVALRFAGFEIRDSILAWVYGQGMPKSHSVSKNLAKKHGGDAPEVKRWEGWGTGLKPAQEPVVVARKPVTERSIPANVLRHGVGAININGTRIGGDGHSDQGRWPANFLLGHTPGCRTAPDGGCEPGCPAKVMDDQARALGCGGKGGVREYFCPGEPELPLEAVLSGDAAPAYYCPKPSVAERDAGLADAATAGSGPKRSKARALRGRQKAFAPRDTKSRLNPHTTVKPAGVMLWLATLVTPPGGVILDPFCGSGSTGVAVGMANANADHAPGWSFVGIEADFEDAGFVETARKRIRHAAAGSMAEANSQEERTHTPRVISGGLPESAPSAKQPTVAAAPKSRQLPDGVGNHISPFRYAGGKGPLLPQTRAWLSSLPCSPHLIEGFAGGASVGLTALVEGQAPRLTLIELDPDVASAWRVIFSPSYSALAQQLRAVPTVDHAREVLAGPSATSDVEQALHLLLLNRLRRNGILAPGAGLISPNRPATDYRFNPESLARRVELLGMRRKRVEVIQGDALEVLPAYADDKRAAFYIDPPYSAPGGPAKRLYRHWALDHERLFEVVGSLRGHVLISHQDHQLTRQLGSASGFRLATVGVPTSNGRRGELLMSRNLDWVAPSRLPVTVVPLDVPDRSSVHPAGQLHTAMACSKFPRGTHPPTGDMAA